MGFRDAQRSGHDGQQNGIDGIFPGDHRNDPRFPCLGQQLRILAGDQHHPLRIRQGKRQPPECRFVQDQDAMLRRVRTTRRIRHATRNCGPAPPEPPPRMRRRRSKAEPIASWTTPLLRPALRLLLLRVAVQALVLLEVLAGVLQILGGSSARLRGNSAQAFLVCLVYSGLPNEAVEQTRNPPSTIDGGQNELQLGH